MEKKVNRVVKKRKKIYVSASFLDPALKAQVKPSLDRQARFK
jgi:hypothetical protein